MPLNPPDRLRLLDVALEVLEHDQGPASDGAAYERRIALSLLRLVRRELAMVDALLADERLRLVSLLGNDADVTVLNAALCDRIRHRELNINDRSLLRTLRLTTLAKLAIDNPRYSGYRRAVGAQAQPEVRDRRPADTDTHGDDHPG